MPWLKLIPSKKISEVFRVNSKLFRGCQWSKIDALSQPESLTLEFGSLPDGFKRSNPINVNSYFSNLSPGQRKLKPMKLFNTVWSFKANFERVWFKKKLFQKWCKNRVIVKRDGHRAGPPGTGLGPVKNFEKMWIEPPSLPIREFNDFLYDSSLFKMNLLCFII